MSSAKRKASPPPAGRGKRKRVVLTISQKLEICDLLTSRRLSYGDIARKYGIGRQTVADIKKKEKDLREFQRREFQRVFIIQTIWIIQTHEKVRLPNTVWIIEVGLYYENTYIPFNNWQIHGLLLEFVAILFELVLVRFCEAKLRFTVY